MKIMINGVHRWLLHGVWNSQRWQNVQYDIFHQTHTFSTIQILTQDL